MREGKYDREGDRTGPSRVDSEYNAADMNGAIYIKEK